MYASIGDDPSYERYKRQVAPLLRDGSPCSAISGRASTPTRRPSNGPSGTGSGPTAGGATGLTGQGGAPGAHLHQVEIDRRKAGGVGVDINHIRKPNFGQWD